MVAPASIRTFTIFGVAIKRCASLIFLLVSVLMMSGRAAAADSEAAESVVQAQLNAYNAHDVDAFLATYSDDIEVYDFPASLRYKGKLARRRANPKASFEMKNLSIQRFRSIMN